MEFMEKREEMISRMGHALYEDFSDFIASTPKANWYLEKMEDKDEHWTEAARNLLSVHSVEYNNFGETIANKIQNGLTRDECGTEEWQNMMPRIIELWNEFNR